MSDRYLPDDPSMREVFDYVDNDAPEWIHELVYDWQLTYETAYVFGQLDIEPVDTWDTVRIDADGPDEWSITITYEDGTSDTIDYDGNWGGAWALFDLAEGRDDLEAERGEIEY